MKFNDKLKLLFTSKHGIDITIDFDSHRIWLTLGKPWNSTVLFHFLNHVYLCLQDTFTTNAATAETLTVENSLILPTTSSIDDVRCNL